MKNLLEIMFSLLGVICMIFSGYNVWGSYERITDNDKEWVRGVGEFQTLKNNTPEGVELTFGAKVANIFCFGCVTESVRKAIKDGHAADIKKIQDELAKLRKDQERAKKDFQVSIIAFLMGLAYEIWQFRRFRQRFRK